MNKKNLIQSERLSLRQVDKSDGDFILKLLNDENYIKFIRDSGVRSIPESLQFIEEYYTSSYDKNGFGLYLVSISESQEPIGICGLLKRDWLDVVDIGFAFISEQCGKGYGYESAHAVITYGLNNLNINRIGAITSQDNKASIALLEKLGFSSKGLINYMDTEEKVFYLEYTT